MNKQLENDIYFCIRFFFLKFIKAKAKWIVLKGLRFTLYATNLTKKIKLDLVEDLNIIM